MNVSHLDHLEVSHYDIRSRAGVLVWSFVTLVIGSMTFVIPGTAGKGGPSPLGIVFGLMFLAGGIWMARTVCGIHLHPDGLVEFRRAIGTTAMRASDIRMLEGKLESGYDGKEWKLVVRHANGTVKIDEFADARFFADRVRELNPHAGITGTWPMGPPELPSGGRRVPP